MWNRLIALLERVGRDKLYHFIAGMLIASFFSLVCRMGAACILPVFVAAFCKEFIDVWRYGLFDWHDLIATLLGGVPIAIFAVL